MGYELAEQLDWELPDWIIYPTGGGTGMVGMWKAFAEMSALGWIDPARRPHMVTVQAAGCAPIVRAFGAGAEKAAPWENAHTIADGLRVPQRDRRLPGAAGASARATARPLRSATPRWSPACATSGASKASAPPPKAAPRSTRSACSSSEGPHQAATDRVVVFNTGGALQVPGRLVRTVVTCSTVAHSELPA